jgi:NTP pyrophosphatase (non-canonical NTP hydrolase)
MTNSIQQNSSSAIYKINAEVSEAKRAAQENERLLLTLFDSLKNLSDKLAKLDFQIKKKIIEESIKRRNRGESK